MQLTTAAAQCCHSPAMGLNNAHCFRGMSKLKCSAVLHSLDESWLLFLPEGLGRDCVKLDFFFQNSFSTFGVVALQFHPRNFITAFIRHLFSIFVLILRVIQIIFASCICIQYITYSVNLVMFKDSFLLIKDQMNKKIRRIWHSNCYFKLGIRIEQINHNWKMFKMSQRLTKFYTLL